MKNTRKCNFCNNYYIQAHGNQLYCNVECKNYKKSGSQYKLYGILKDYRKGFINNYKLFEKLLDKQNRKEFPLSHIDLIKFNPNAYFGKFITESKETLYSVGEFNFQVIIKNNISYLIISNKK